MSFFEELKRRNVFKVAVAYLITSWVALQLADIVLENIDAPAWILQVFMLALVLGFPLVLIFAWAFELTPEGIKKEKDVDRSESITHQTGQKLNKAIIAILSLAVVVLLVERFLPKHAAQAPTEPEQTQAVPEEKTKSIAVLPFVNMSSDTEQEYFSDGISEEILNSLARVKDLKVAGRTSSFAFKGKNQDLRQIGNTLGVEHILEGSVRKSGTKVRITAQLIQVEDGFHLWSDTYDRELTDVFAIQDEIARAILEQLKAHLLEGGASMVVTTTRTDSEVYDKYLLARQRLYERNHLTIESAIQLLDEAIALDPEYAPAYAQRGIATLLASDEGYGTIPNDQAEAQSLMYFEKALALDPNQAEAWAGRGLYHAFRTGEYQQAIEALEKALAINPSLIDASNWLQIALTNAGDDLGSMKILEEMVERDPLYKPGVGNLITSYNDFGMTERSWALIERVRPFMPNEPNVLRWQGWTHLYEGSPSKGLPFLEEAHRQQPNDWIFHLNFSIALDMANDYERLAEEGVAWPRIMALGQLGRTEEAYLAAMQEAKDGKIEPLFTFLVHQGRSDEMVNYLEERWPNLDAFQDEYPAGATGYHLMLLVALCYARAGNTERFHDAMERVRAAHDNKKIIGIDNWVLRMNEARYLVLAGDKESAIDQLERAADSGFIGSYRYVDRWPEFEPLEGDPRYEAIQARTRERLNSERVELGLDPLTS